MNSILSSITASTGGKINDAMDNLRKTSENLDVTDLAQMGEVQMQTMILTTSVQMKAAMTKAIEDALKSVTQRLS